MASKNDEAWDLLFKQYDILGQIRRDGFFEIDASTIRTVREPRLMSKFDHEANLPEIFQINGLAILPISRSRYIIGHFDAYHQLGVAAPVTGPILIPFPDHIRSIDPANLYSENAVLHCAYVSGMIDRVMGEKSWPTVSGRMSSGDFDFLIRNKSMQEYLVTIAKSQVEIDAGYEGLAQVMLVEAKNESVEDFLIRQLYYPYRLWETRMAKPIMPVFLTFSNDVFSFFVYEFLDPHRYNSLRLVRQHRFMLTHEGISLDDIHNLLNTVHIVPEPTVPFPQADVFERIVDLLGILVENDLTKDEITLNYAFDERQTNYYTTAGIYLGLIKKYQSPEHTVLFGLSHRGREIMGQPYKKKYLMLATCILEHGVFQRVLREYLQQGDPLTRERVVHHMKQSGLYKVGAESTYGRRAQTVGKWVEWILSLQSQ